MRVHETYPVSDSEEELEERRVRVELKGALKLLATEAVIEAPGGVVEHLVLPGEG